MKIDIDIERDLRHKNIAVMFRSTAIAMILSELTGVIAVLIDGIIASRGLGIDAYSGISLLRPFSSVVLMIAGFFSTGCNIVCSKLVGAGRKEEANEAFNLTSFLVLAAAVILILLCLCFPTAILNLCGVDLTKYPELNPHLYSYLHGYMIGIPAMMLIHVFSPLVVMDSGKRLYSVSASVLCAADILGDLLNVYVFRGGAFGLGLATSAAYLVQMLILIIHFVKRSHYFHLSLKTCRLSALKEIARNGSPELVKKLEGTLRDILVNYINIMVAVSSVAIAARGIQSDLFTFLFCIPTGLGRTLITMVGIYYSANDLLGLKRLLSYAARFGIVVSGIAGLLTYITAPLLTGLYTSIPEVSALGVYSIRWMSVALVFDTAAVLIQHYLQGTGNVKHANILSTLERFAVPVSCALVMGLLFGSRGILASVAVSKIILIFLVLLNNCIINKGIPRELNQILFLPKDFGGAQCDNKYAEIRTREDVMRISQETYAFCLAHHTPKKKAMLTALFVEEMGGNVFDHADKRNVRNVRIDFHLFVNDENIYFNLMDLGDLFDPTLFYSLHKENTDHIGIRMVTEMAKEVHYFSTFKSNNLTVYT